MSEWKKYRLKDIANVQTGPFGSQLHQKDYAHIGTPIITVEHLGENRITHHNLPLVSDTDKNRLSKYLLQEGDIVFSRVGSVDRRALVSKKEDGWLFSGRCLRVRTIKSKADGAYLSYYFGQESFKEYIRRIAVGATMPSINTTILSEIEVILPDLPTQTLIAEILSSLDDKIELNNKINQELEALAQTLFKRWFVDFEFPNENGEPYKSSGGEMVDSELGEIPKGWVAQDLVNLFDFLEGPGLRNWQYRETGMPFINIRLIQNGDIVSKSASCISFEEFELKYKHFELCKGDMVVSTSGTLGKVAIVRESHIPLMLNTSVIRFRPKFKEIRSFMYQYLQSKIFEDELKSQASGSVQLNFGPVHLKRIKLVTPNHKLLEIFETAVLPNYNMIIENREENQRLKNLRDTLLPKLISGELEVS